jgi:hypothetical protein
MSVNDVVLQPTTQHFGITVSDYGSDFELLSFTGINTSQEFKPSTSDPSITEVKDDDFLTGGEPVFEQHVSVCSL